MTLNFYKLWVSQILSTVTANMLAFVLIIRVFEATHSSIAIGLLLAIYTLPSLLLGIFAGVFVDRWSKRSILILTNLLQALVILLFLGVRDSIWPIYTLVFLYSLVDEFYNPAQTSFLPSLVPKEKLATANSLIFLTLNGSLIVGYGLGGPMVRFFGERTPFAFGSFFLLLAAASAFLLPHDTPRKNNYSNGFEGVWQELKEGVSFIKERRKVLYPFLFFALVQMAVSSTGVLFPSFAADVLKINLTDSAIFVVIPAGLGALIGSVFLNRVLRVLGRRLTILLAVFSAGIVVLLLSFAVPATTNPKIFAPLLITLLGLSVVLITAPVLAFLQEVTPFDFRGRVFGGLSALMTWGSWLPIFIAATATDLFGVTWTLAVIGIAILAFGLYLRRKEYINLSLQGG